MVAVPLCLDAGFVTKLVGAVTEVEGIGPSGVSGHLVAIGNMLVTYRWFMALGMIDEDFSGNLNLNDSR